MAEGISKSINKARTVGSGRGTGDDWFGILRGRRVMVSRCSVTGVSGSGTRTRGSNGVSRDERWIGVSRAGVVGWVAVV
jgi:hypothetical protein